MAKAFTFKEQANYFQKKLNLPTDTYLDIMGKAHDYYFVVAGANRNEIVLGLRQAVDAAIRKGETFEDFKKRFAQVVEKTGWQPKGKLNHRARTVFHTNLYSAYNKGRLKQQLEMADVMPYWEYKHNHKQNPRQEHLRLDGVIRPAGDPFWQVYYPIKAYGCHCTVIAHDDDDLKRMGRTVSPRPKIEYVNKRVGVRSGNPREVRIPRGYDAGFAPHDFGDLNKSRLYAADEIYMKRLVDADPSLASTLFYDLVNKRPQALELFNQSFAMVVDEVMQNKQAKGVMKYVGAIPKKAITTLKKMGKAPQSAIIAMRDSDILHALRDSKQKKGLSMPMEFFKKLPEHISEPTAILLDETQKMPTLVYVYETQQGKLAIKLDYKTEIKNKETKEREKRVVNLVRTGSIAQDATSWENFKRNAQIIWGKLD